MRRGFPLRHSSTYVWLFVLAALLLVVLSGCGGNASPTNGGETPSSSASETPSAGKPTDESVSSGSDGIVDDGKPINVPIAGQSAKGLVSLVGEGVNEMVRREYPGSSLTYEPGNMAGDLVEIADGNRYPLTLGVSAMAIEKALKGEAPFQRKYEKDEFQIVATITDGMQTQVFASKEFVDKHGIKTLDDIREKKVSMRIGINQPGNLQEQAVAASVLREYGITRDDIKSWGGEIFDIPLGDLLGLYKDGKLDVIIGNLWPPDGKMVEASRTTPMTLFPLSQTAVDNIAEEFGLETTVIPKGTYDFLEADYPSVSIPLYIIAGKLADEQLTYKMAKALYNNYDYFKGLHPIFGSFDKSMLAKHGRYPLHPGAEQFYREVGLVK